MTTRTALETIIEDPKWATGTISGKRSDVAIVLQSFPGIVGGEFKALVTGLLPEHFGRAEVTISCVGVDPHNRRQTNENYYSSNPDVSFLEVESLQIGGPTLQIHFLIPFEAKGTDEGFDWHLQIQFANGRTEVFEVPICRTCESSPEVSELEIAAAGLCRKEQWYEQKEKVRSGRSRMKPFELRKTDDELLVSIPSRIPGRPCLAKGLGIFWGIWATVTALFYWVFEGEVEPMLILGIPLFAMTVLLAFMLFGVSKNRINQEGIVQRHSLLGLSFPKRIKRSDVTGFLPKCIGSLGDAGGSYLIIAETKQANVFLSAALLNKSDARTLAKRLNSFWDIKQHY